MLGDGNTWQFKFTCQVKSSGIQCSINEIEKIIKQAICAILMDDSHAFSQSRVLLLRCTSNNGNGKICVFYEGSFWPSFLNNSSFYIRQPKGSHGAANFGYLMSVY